MPEPISAAVTAATAAKTSASAKAAQTMAFVNNKLLPQLQSPWQPQHLGGIAWKPEISDLVCGRPDFQHLPGAFLPTMGENASIQTIGMPDLLVPGVGGISIASLPIPDSIFMKLLIQALKNSGINMGVTFLQGEDNPAVMHSAIAACTAALPAPARAAGSAATAATPRNGGAAPAPAAGKDSAIILGRREIGEIKAPDQQTVRRAAVETYLDSRFGNIKDLTAGILEGRLEFKAFMLALTDALDAVTFGALRPVLLRVMVNPHLKHRMVVYQSENKVTECSLPYKPDAAPKLKDGVHAETGTLVERRITQCSRFDIELSQDLFDKFGMDFSQFADSVIRAGLADKTVVFSSLDEKEIKYAVGSVKDGTQRDETLRQRRVEGTEDLMVRPMTADEYVKSEGKLMVDKTLHQIITNKVYEQVKDPVTTIVQETPEKVVNTGRETVKSHEIKVEEHIKKETSVVESQMKDNITGQVSAVDTTGKVLTTTTVETTTKDLDTTRYRLFGFDTDRLLGKNTNATAQTRVEQIVTETPLVADSTGDAHPGLQEGDEKVVLNRVQEGEEVKSSEFSKGLITYVPGGQIANLGLKSGLGAELNWKDYTAATIEGVLIGAGVAATLVKGGASAAGAANVVSKAKVARKISGRIKNVPGSGFKFKAVPDAKATVFRPRHLPTSGGAWTGKPGNSIWMPDKNLISKLNNPKGLTTGAIWEKIGLKGEGIPFHTGRVDFREAAIKGKELLTEHFRGLGFKMPDIATTMHIPGFSADRVNNFRLFDRMLERALHVPEGSINNTLLNALGLTRHELTGGRMQLVPTLIHSLVPHSGGVAEFKYLTSL